MRNLLALTIVFCLAMVGVIYAAPVGNPAKPILVEGESPFTVGVELDFVTERELDVSGEDVAVDKLNWYSAKIAYAFEDKVELYCLLGAADGEFSEKYAGVDLLYETETEFAWGLGATVLLNEFENGIRLGLDGRYRQVEPSVDKVNLNGTEYSIPSGSVTSIDIEYSEWQIALGISKEINSFVPYGGIKYSDVEASMKATISGTTYTTDDVDSDNVFGIFIGCDFLANENFSIGVEGRFIDETAFSVRGVYRF